jgi:hypothetical protein
MGKKSKAATSSTGVPAWLEGYYKDIASKAQAQNAQAFPEYDVNARMAGQSDQTLQSLNFLEDTAFNQIGAYDQSMDIFSNLAGQSGLDQYQQYVNPYMEDVLGQARSNFRDQAAMDASALAAQKGSAGAFGGSRFAVAEDLMKNRNLDKLNELETSQRAAAYESGWDRYFQDYSNQAGGAMNLMQGAGTAQQGYQASAAQLGQVGMNTDIRAQGMADLQYQDFMDRQNWERSKLGDYANLVYGQGPVFGTTTQSGGGSSGAGQAIGTAISVGATLY